MGMRYILSIIISFCCSCEDVAKYKAIFEYNKEKEKKCLIIREHYRNNHEEYYGGSLITYALYELDGEQVEFSDGRFVRTTNSSKQEIEKYARKNVFRVEYLNICK